MVIVKARTADAFDLYLMQDDCSPRGVSWSLVIDRATSYSNPIEAAKAMGHASPIDSGVAIISAEFLPIG